MNQVRGSTDYWVKVTARFMIDSNGAIDKLSDYYAILYDKNPITYNRIASEFLGRNGRVSFEFPLLASIRNKETPFETKPDLFIELYRKNDLVYTTKVYKNVDFFIHDEYKRQQIQNTRNLGTFKVKIKNIGDYEVEKAGA